MSAAFSEPHPAPFAKIGRAKSHLANFEAQVQEFYNRKPYAISVEEKQGQRTYRAIKLLDTPAELSLIAGDAIHNARSALDHMVAAFVDRGGGDIDRASFPFQTDPVGIKGKIRDKSPKASAGARKFLFRLKPYKTGNSMLWRLHSLDLADKHRMIIPVGTVYAKTRMTPKKGRLPDGKIPYFDHSKKTSRFLKHGDVIFSMPIVPELDAHFDQKTTFDVRFRDPAGVHDEDAVTVMRRLVLYAEKIIWIANRRGLF